MCVGGEEGGGAVMKIEWSRHSGVSYGGISEVITVVTGSWLAMMGVAGL